MFLRQTRRKKDGKTHSYWSVVENQRVEGGRVVQRHVLYLGEISPSQAAAWRKSIEVFDEDAGHPRTLALFPEDRCTAVTSDSSIVQLRLSEMRLCRPRQWGACWLAGQLWAELQLDRFWADRLPVNRKGTRWDQVLQVLVSYRLIAPGSEWKLHRDWFGRSAMADVLGSDFCLAEPHKLYERRVEAHIFIAFLAYCLQVTLQRRLHALAPGLTARSALEKFAAVQMIDVHLPTTDGRELRLTRHTQPESELQLLIRQLKFQLPPQPPPKITTAARHLM
jgi:hypothetical protein